MSAPQSRRTHRAQYVTRACDLCKRRKVKCDARRPCAACSAAGRECSYAIVQHKRGRVGKRDGGNPAGNPAVMSTSPDAIEETGNSGDQLGSAIDASDQPASAVVHSDSELVTAILASPDGNVAAERIRASFIESVASLLVCESVEDLVIYCIGQFMQFLFPNTPICHEATLRAGVPLFRVHKPNASPGGSAMAKPFTLVTALCALVLAVLPDEDRASRAALASAFLQASRVMLRTYEHHDLQDPDWTSLTIRIWQSSATLDATGRAGEAIHYYTEAAVMVLQMRLFNEESISKEPPLEAQLLRSIFWQLYLSDKSATVLDRRLYFVTEDFFDREFTLLARGEPEIALLDTNREGSSLLLNSRFHEGHHLKRQMWRDAVNLLNAITSRPAGESDDDLSRLYLDFAGFSDRFPAWLWSVDSYIDERSEPDIAERHKMCFWAQRSTITIPFYTLKLAILQTCIDHDVPGIMGLDRNDLMWQQRKLDFGRDVLSELYMVPFRCIKMQGEPAVQRLRKVGTVLLELVHNARDESIQARARSQLGQIMDTLARLDSRATDDLH